MLDPFESSRRKITRADDHLTEFKRGNAFFLKQHLYEYFSEPHPDKPQLLVHKIRLKSQIPDGLSEMVGDVVDNLRAALDHAMYSVAIASGCADPLNAYFPFSRDAAHFENNLKGRCADVPKEIYPLLRSFEPYKGGSDALWALNEVCIANKHKLLIPMGTATFTAGLSAEGTGFVEMPYPAPVWDRTKNEMELFTVASDSTFKGDFKFAMYIAFGEAGLASGKPAIPILDQFVDMVETIVAEIAAESKRLGIVK